jgi:ankyrin repeat protein
MISAWSGRVEEVAMLVENGACINQQDKGNGFAALIKVVFNNNIDVVRYLLGKGADVTISSFERKTALDYAYEKNHQKIIKTLKENSND